MANTVQTSSGGLQDITATGAPIPDADTQAVTTSGGSLQEVVPASGGDDTPVTWNDIEDKPSTFPADPASVIAAMASKQEIGDITIPDEDFNDLTEVTAKVRQIIEALQAK